MASEKEARVRARQAELEHRDELERLGEAVQREAQLRRRQVALEQSEKDKEREAEAIRRQFIELANKHNFESLDPIRSAPVPYTDRVQDAESRTFKRYELYAGIVGTVVAGGLFAATIAANAAAVLPIGIVLTGLLSGVFVGVVIVSTFGNPRNPDARATLALWNNVFGAIAALSLLGILWLRFVSNVTTLELIAIPISTFELSMYGLCGTFGALAAIYGWSRELTEEFQRVMAEKTTIQQELANVAVELMELEYQRETRRTPDEKLEKGEREQKETPA